MSTTVDSRVLEMRFDNKQFEDGVSTTMSSLDKLKQKLNFTGASKGLEDVGKSAKNVDMSGLGRGIDAIHAKFSALQVMGITALSNITNQAMYTGKKIVKAFTIDPVKTGFQEYETQIGAIQTILANTKSKGSTLQDVNRALDELNTYADKTIYNFTQMTKNIGTFTAAGVDLDRSVSSIKGIANLAAVSGSTSMQASNAMYQLSQALAAGRVSLMDWNSVVNAGMGGELFQNALKRTAKHMGKNVDAAMKKYGSFRESLTRGEWLTTEVLTETLTQLSGAYSEADLIAKGYTKEQAKDIAELAETAVKAATEVKTFTQLFDTLKEAAQSGWSQSWRLIVGDFGEAKDMLTGISDVLSGMLNSSAESRNKMLTEGLSTGWKQLLSQGISDEEGFKDSIKEVAKERGIAIDEMINDSGSFEKTLKQGWLTGDILTESLDKLTKKVSGLSEEQLKEMGYTTEQVRTLTKLNDAVKNGTINMDEFAKKMMISSGRENMIAGFKNIFDGIISVIKPVKEAFRDIFPAITGEQLYAFTEQFKKFTSHLKLSSESASKVKSTFKGIFSVIDIGVEAFKAVGKGIVEIISNLTGLGGGLLSISGSFGDFLSSIRDSVVEGNLFGKVVNKIVGFITNAIDAIKNFGKEVNKNIDTSDMFKGMFGFFKGILNVILKVGSVIGDIFGDIGTFFSDAFANGDMFKAINEGLFAGILASIQAFFLQLNISSFSFTSVFANVGDILETYQNKLRADLLIKIATAIGILAVSLHIMSSIPEDKLGGSVTAISILFGELVGAMIALEKIGDVSTRPLKEFSEGLAGIARTISMIGLGASILILVGAMKLLSNLEWEEIKKGLVGIGSLTGMLLIAAKIMNTESKSITKFAGQMILMSVAIGILTVIGKQIATMSLEELAKAGSGILGIITMLVLAAQIMDRGEGSITKFGGQMILMSVAIGALTYIGKELSSMSLEELAIGGSGLLGLVTILVAAAKIMDKGKGSITKFGGQMLLMAASLAILTPVLKTLGSLSDETLIRGLGAISVVLVEFALGLHAMNGTLLGSTALVIAAGALTILTKVLKSLGSMNIENIIKSLGTLAVTFGIIGAAGYLLAPLIPAMLGLAGAFTLFGIATAAFGFGVTAIAAGFTALAAAGTAGATAFVASLGVIITGVLSIVPQIAQIIGRIIVELARILGEYAPLLAESFFKLIAGVLDSLATYAPQIVDSLLTFFIGVLNSLADHMPTLIQAAMNFLGALFRGIVDALNGIDTENLLKGVFAVGIMTALMYALSGVVALIPSAMAGMLGVGVVIAEMSLVLAAIGGLAQIPGLEWLISEGGDFLQKIGEAIGKFVGGIAGGMLEGVSSSLPQFATDLSTFMKNLQPFIEGAKGINPSMMEGVESLAKTVMIITATDVLDSITSFITGGNSIGEFANKLVPLGEGMKKYGEAVAGINVPAVAMSALAAKSLVEVANAIPPEGGFWSLLAGEKDLGSFGKKLIPFGMGMKMYAMAVTGIDIGAITSSAVAAKSLVEVASSIPPEGGFWSLLAGEKDLGSFGLKLIPFGMGMKMYAMAVSGINAESIILSAEAAKAMVKVAESIPPEGGIWGLLTGEKDLGSFGQKLVPFGEAMGKYSKSVSGLNGESIAASVEASKAMVKVAKTIPPELKVSASSDDITIFGSKIKQFGIAMKEYSIIASGINTFAIISSATAAGSLVTLLKSMIGINTSWASMFVKSINILGTAQVSKFIQAFSGATPKMAYAAQNLMQAFINGIRSKQGSLIASVNSIISLMSTTILNKQSIFQSAGVKIIAGLMTGITNKRATVNSVMVSLASSGVSGIRNSYRSFVSAGEYLGSGLIIGINRKKQAVRNAGYSLGRAAVEGEKAGQNSHSPSKETIKAGKWLGEGLIIGMKEMGRHVYNSAHTMGETATNSMSEVVNRISDMINTDVDVQPTIRPVLDLSNVKSGSKTLNGLLNTSTNIGISTKVDKVNSLMTERYKNQNGGNNEVVSAINKLGKHLNNIGGNTYNVNGVTYDDGSTVSNIIEALIREIRVERRS